MGTSAIRGLANAATAIVETVGLSLAGIATYPFSPGGDAYLALARLWGRSLFRAWGIKLRVEGSEKVDFDRPQIYMCNHQSHTDILALYATIPTPVRFLAKKELKYIPVFGWGMAVANYVFIDRSRRDEAFRSIDLAAARIAKGHAVVVFPEGTRSDDATLGSFKKGGFVLAMKSGVPVVPIGIVGTYGVLPKRSWQIRASDVTVRFGDPIPTTGVTRDELMARVRAAIGELASDAAAAAAASGRLPGRRVG
ncbi:MAG: 1-acyl-sn-glycerol-3-phosphate acyltransferase [Deltaproteobacteria bacterium]|nr:1-acyl-sn-glycerol-3-phosphate acyltransferase [Deltaproteobacteria bacterium]